MHASSASGASENATERGHRAETVFGRLGKNCAYTEDSTETHFATGRLLDRLQLPPLPFANSSVFVDTTSHETLQQSAVDLALQTFGSLDNLLTIATEFFTGTHQRISALSRLRFNQNLQMLASRPRADFAALCLSILLMQQMPTGETSNMQSPLYLNVKDLIGLLETADGLSLDLLHCRVLVAFYELGHALHTAAYISIAVCARSARALGLHRKAWRHFDAASDHFLMEERKRIWWTIINMERFVSLANGDAFFMMQDPEQTDALPIEDLIWAESSHPADLERLIATPPSLDTPLNITVGQLARECQIFHLVGRVVQHVFDPTPDPAFNAEEAAQLERTLVAYLPLLANEELKIGKYCGAFGACNSALFGLYEYMLLHGTEDATERQRILESTEKTSLRAITFAEAAYQDQEGNYSPDTYSPYLPYSLCQSAIVQYRLWKQNGDLSHKRHLDSLRSILLEITKRWKVAWQYLEIIDNLQGSWPPIMIPFQGYFIGIEAI
ncbi:hypothetical protein BP5796_11973 [Coleophoma crateriformis]|uniref:Xylanolytic transcriptional activator regulatory domain-containing protein n=1 Tax=Coleophoma crateriformis TaxID=565419 RepID=A0A3D8QBB0_9HELO|nr:hypothetical protein BP5796_11973 [Coleophoma crateriformis]